MIKSLGEEGIEAIGEQKNYFMIILHGSSNDFPCYGLYQYKAMEFRPDRVYQQKDDQFTYPKQSNCFCSCNVLNLKIGTVADRPVTERT